MLVISKNQYTGTFRNDSDEQYAVRENLMRFMEEAHKFVQVTKKKIDEDTFEITHKSLMIEEPRLRDIEWKISQLLNSGASPSLVAREIMYFIVHGFI